MTQRTLLCSKAVIKISSFDQKPDNGKIPAIAHEAISIVMKVIGIAFFKPPILRMSCSPPRA